MRQPAPKPKRVYYGWTIITTLAVAEITSWGILYYAFTVFLEPMHATLGWSRVSITGAFSLALVLSGVVGIPLGRWLDRRGPRLLMSAGSCVATLLLLAWSFVGSLAAFYLIWAGLGITMAAVLYEPAFWVVSAWFNQRRGQALTVLTLVAGLASVIYVPLAGWLVAVQGWRHALLTLAVLLAVGTIPIHALVLRRRPADLGLLPDGETARTDTRDDDVSGATVHVAGVTPRVALRSASFWLVTAAFVLSTLCTGVVFVYLVPYLITRGYPAHVAATAVGVIGLIALPGRLVLTPLGDWLPRGRLTAGLFLSQTVAVLILLVGRGDLGVIGFVVLFGAGFGAISPARAALVAEYFGPAHFGSINGMVALALNLARAIAPVGAGIVIEATGGYQPTWWILAALSALSALAAVLAERKYARAVPPLRRVRAKDSRHRE